LGLTWYLSARVSALVPLYASRSSRGRGSRRQPASKLDLFEFLQAGAVDRAVGGDDIDEYLITIFLPSLSVRSALRRSASRLLRSLRSKAIVIL
jgi:hypothetical protein